MAYYFRIGNGSRLFNYRLKRRVWQLEEQVRNEVKSRSFLVSNELRNSTVKVLSGVRHGRIYRFGRRTYQASRPGEPPAVRTGTLRLSFRPRTILTESSTTGDEVIMHSQVATDVKYAVLERGIRFRSGRYIAPRPYGVRAIKATIPKAAKIYRRPYFR